jgi:hypothetical protein
MREEIIYFKERVSFQGDLFSLTLALKECQKNENLDETVIATWNANISSCSHRYELSSAVEFPSGTKIDDFKMIVCIISIAKYGKISVIINHPRDCNTLSYKMSYDTTVLGLIFEDTGLEEKKDSVLMSLHKILQQKMIA